MAVFPFPLSLLLCIFGCIGCIAVCLFLASDGCGMLVRWLVLLFLFVLFSEYFILLGNRGYMYLLGIRRLGPSRVMKGH